MSWVNIKGLKHITGTGTGTGTGMGKIIQKQAEIGWICQYVINWNLVIWTLLNVVNSIKKRVGMTEVNMLLL